MQKIDIVLFASVVTKVNANMNYGIHGPEYTR